MTYSFDRKSLKRKLELVAPAVGKNRHHKQHLEVYFTELGLAAANDLLVLVAAFDDDAPLIGVDATRLHNLVATSTADKVQFKLRPNGALQVDTSNFSATIYTNDGDPPFRWPSAEDLDGLPLIYVDKPMAEALELTRRIVDPEAPNVQGSGVTLMRTAGLVRLYATDSASFLKQTFQEGHEEGLDLRVVLHMASVEQLIRLAPGWMYVGDDYVLFEAGDGQVSMNGRTILPATWLDAETRLAERTPRDRVPVPDGFAALVKRAGATTPRDTNGRKTVKLSFDGERLTVTSNGPTGTLSDWLDCSHPPVMLNIDQQLIERLLKAEVLTRLGANTGNLVLASADDSVTYLMSSPRA